MSSSSGLITHNNDDTLNDSEELEGIIVGTTKPKTRDKAKLYKHLKTVESVEEAKKEIKNGLNDNQWQYHTRTPLNKGFKIW
jgi:hypothetical protein